MVKNGRILFVGHCYYNTTYLAKELKKLGWMADVLNTDYNRASLQFYHGEDYSYLDYEEMATSYELGFFLDALLKYDIFHFTGAHNLRFSNILSSIAERYFGEKSFDIKLLKKLEKKIIYTNNGCLDGVSQTSFNNWEGENACSICIWRDNPDVCSDEKNLAWGKYRNEMADYQVLLGGNRADYNIDSRIHEVPEYYCLDSNIWRPDLGIPEEYDLKLPKDTFKIYHAVGNFDLRSDTATKKNIKCTNIYMEVIEKLKKEGYKVEMIFARDIPNKDVKYYQLQADVICDMLTFGFFGANIREGMMLGKPCICYIRPEWENSMRDEIPDYADELPVISATPDTIYDTLVDLINNREKLKCIGEKSREFAVKWHSSTAGALRFEKIYSELLKS